MRACAAILIFSAWPCFIQTFVQNSHTKRETSSNFADTSDNLIHQISLCVKKLGLTKCIGAYGNWRAEGALDNDVRVTARDTFPWQLYENISNEEIQTKLCDNTVKLLERKSLKLNLTESYVLELGGKGNGSLSVDILKCDDEASGRSSMKKLRKHFYKIMPFLLIPGLIMSAILPFFLPSLKMMTLAAGMLNNMALTGAVFTLLRNNAFNDKYHKKIIYINDGYYNDKYEPLADTPSQVIVDAHFDNKYHDFETHDIKDYNFIGNQPIDTDYRLNSDWLKGISSGKVRNVKILPESFSTSDWRKQDDVVKNVEGAEENKIN